MRGKTFPCVDHGVIATETHLFRCSGRLREATLHGEKPFLPDFQTVNISMIRNLIMEAKTIVSDR
jgi:hypothetical protein